MIKGVEPEFPPHRHGIHYLSWTATKCMGHGSIENSLGNNNGMSGGPDFSIGKIFKRRYIL